MSPAEQFATRLRRIADDLRTSTVSFTRGQIHAVADELDRAAEAEHLRAGGDNP